MKKGFTLIELLVVIAIIGILSSVVLVSLNSARNKGKDSRVISSVQQTRTILESNYNGATYPDLTATSPLYGGFVASGNPGSTSLNALITDVNAQGSAFTIVPTGTGAAITAYAIYGKLVSDPNKYFCIDSTGKTNTAASAATGATCPQ